MPRSERPRAQPRNCGQSGESSCDLSVPRRTTSPFLTSALLNPLLPQSTQQLHGIHSPGFSSTSPVSLIGVFSLKPTQPVAPSAAEPTVANPAHFSRLRLLIPLSRADDFISSIAPYSFHMTCMSTRTRCSRWIIIFKGIAGASRAESLFALIVFVEFPPISLFAKI